MGLRQLGAGPGAGSVRACYYPIGAPWLTLYRHHPSSGCTMTEFDRLWVWSDPATRSRLGWYREVAANRRPAKFRIAATIPLQVALNAAEADLWAELERLTPTFLDRWRKIREDGGRLGPKAQGPSLLELCRELAFRMLAHCNFCRWNCRVDRSRETKLGACKLGAGTRVATWFHHQGEELVYRGSQGSGTIFFYLVQHALRVLPERRHQHR
jgi:putative pyruvate formate lyase activating enzyme